MQRYSLLAVMGVIALGNLTSGCTAAQMEKLENIGKAPKMEPLQTPMAQSVYQPVAWPQLEDDTAGEVKHVNSLWQPGSRSFFKDQKARRIGDILKVIVEISDKAELDNATSRDRTGSEDSAAPVLFGLEKLATGWLPGKADPSSLLSLDAANSSTGTGTIDREEKIETQIAAMVTQILPNGNLVIRGSQEIRVNYELRQVTVQGIVRPEDISVDNSIDSDMIAEARISYGGNGTLSDLQQPRVGQQVIDILSPF